jgi:hypothetical protein
MRVLELDALAAKITTYSPISTTPSTTHLHPVTVEQWFKVVSLTSSFPTTTIFPYPGASFSCLTAAPWGRTVFSEMTIAFAVSALGMLTAFKTFPSSTITTRCKKVESEEARLTCPDVEHVQILVIDGLDLLLDGYRRKPILETHSDQNWFAEERRNGFFHQRVRFDEVDVLVL